MTKDHATLPLVRAGIGTYRQPVVYMRKDCHLRRAGGGTALTRVRTSVGPKSIVATLNVVTRADCLAMPPRFAAATVRELGARFVGLVAPCPGDIRQDRLFRIPSRRVVATPLAAATRESIAGFDTPALEGDSLTSTRNTKGETDE